MKTVLVLFGGVSSEHEVSRLSVTSVLRNLDRSRYTPVAVGITKDGRWLRYEGSVDCIADGGWESQSENLCSCILSPDRSHHGLLVETAQGWQVQPVDIIFPVLHGKNGEDGTVQGLFQVANIPYVGCDVISSANCMDKDVAKKLFEAAGIPNAHWIAVTRDCFEQLETLNQRIVKELGYPVFVKPANAGSSVGVSKVESVAQLSPALQTAFQEDGKVIIEEMLHGAEVECAVMGNQAPIASAVIGEIIPLRGLYDYNGKYLDGTTQLNIPAHVNETQTAAVREMAVRAYQALGCAGLARVDFFALSDGENVVLNEINTLPGFTSISMYPKLFLASGMEYGQILTKLLELAEDRFCSF